MEGLGRHYNSSQRKPQWGQRLLSSALVYPAEDGYVLGLEPLLSKFMASAEYPYRTAAEALLELATKVRVSAYPLKALLVDAEFTGRKTLVELQKQALAFIGRFKSSHKVIYQAQRIKASALAEQFPAGKSRYYPQLGV